MNSLTIVCGLPGTGKSTLAAALARATGAVHLNTDRIRHRLGRQGQYSAQEKSEVYDHLRDETQKALNAGNAVIVDGTFYKTSLRSVFEALAQSLDVSVCWIEVMASEETIRRRVSVARPYTEADYTVYLKVRDAFEPLPEDHLKLDSDILSKEEMVTLARQFSESTG